MVTYDFVLQYPLRSKYGMPTPSDLEPVYGGEGRYRIPNAEAPSTYGLNIVRLVPEEGAEEITVDFEGLHEPTQYSDWRASIVAVDAEGCARSSPQWSRGQLKNDEYEYQHPNHLHTSAVPSSLPVAGHRRTRSTHPVV